MSTIFSFFLALFHFIALAWATIHPDVPPKDQQAAVRAIPAIVQPQVQTQAEPLTRVVFTSTQTPTAGYWHTSGSSILNERGQAIRIQGINWYGFETVRQAPGGLNLQDYRAILRTIRRNGFNTVRIPFSNQMLERPIIPASISYANQRGPINEPLRGLTSIEVLDRIVDYAGSLGLKVILDNHRSQAGDSAEHVGLWYTVDYPESAWIGDWQRLARRYAGNSTVIGFDLRNEPHNAALGGACWDCGGARDWHLAAQRAGDAVLAINPRLLIFVEGVDTLDGDSYWWGGNLAGVRRSPVVLAVPNQLVYSPHAYGPNEYHQRWFNASTTPASLEAIWNSHWAYISQQGIAPVWVGEFGTTNRNDDIASYTPGSEGQWYTSLISFLARNPDIGWSTWALNGEDPNGVLDPGYNATANPLKMQTLASIMTSQPDASAMMAQLSSTNFDSPAE